MVWHGKNIMIVSYVYKQSMHVMVGTGTLRNTPMNERRYVAYIGVDNTIDIQFKNRDRKPVNITLKTPIWQITNPVTGEAWLRKNAVVTDGPNGLAQVKIAEHDMVGIEPGIYHLGIMLESTDGTTAATYTSTNYDARAELEIRTGAYEAFKEADETLSFSEVFVTPMNQQPPTYPGYSGSLKAAGQLGDNSTLTTVAMHMTNFTGNIHVQESLEVMPTYWFNAQISARGGWDYSSYTGVDTFNIDTRAKWLRISYTPDQMNTGTIDKVVARS